MLRFTLLLLVSIFVSCKGNTSRLDTKDDKALVVSKLIDEFKYNKNASPIISVHRGGVGLVGYPENCLETLQYVNDSISAIFEIDVAKTKDGVLVLMHDNTLERTTTGFDRLDKYSYKELQDFNLVDDFGNETTFKIPKFTDVLNWAKNNKAVLTVDIKRSVVVEEVIKTIKNHQAEDVAIIITYDVSQTIKAHQLAPNLLLSVSARNQDELSRLLAAKIPTQNMLAFTGTRLSDVKLFDSIHQLGIKTMLGTLGNLDKQAATKSDSLYMVWHKMGIDIFATDRPFQAATALNIVKN